LELNYRDRVARLRIVYYGPAAGGKTTNLHILHAAARQDNRGDLVSVNSSQGRTILFDLLPLGGFGLSGWELKFRILAAPGQPAYAAARRLALRGSDAVVFVANSATDRWPDNLASWQELTEGLLQHSIDPRSVPLAFQYNKRDLPEVVSIDEMHRALNARGCPSVAAVACRGEGVLETFAAILESVLQDVTQRYRSLALPAGLSVGAWTRESIKRVFGMTTLAVEGPAPVQMGQGVEPEVREAAEGRRVVRIAAPEPPTGARLDGQPDPSAASRLVDSYAQASEALGHAVEDLREQRDEARRFLDDLRHALATAEGLASNGNSDAGLRSLLERMAATAKSRRASLLAATTGGHVRVVASLTPERDLLSFHPRGYQLISQNLLRLSLVVANDPATPAELAAALGMASPPIHALASVPLHSAKLVHAVFLLYYGPTDVLPTERDLAHLEWMGRGLNASLLANHAMGQARQGWGMLTKAVTGEAALRALGHLDGIVRARPAASGMGMSRSVGDPSLRETAAGLMRAVRGLARGQLDVRTVYLDPLLQRLRAAGFRVAGEQGLAVRGDAALIGLALEALVELAAEQQAHPVLVSARRASAGIELSVSSFGPIPTPPPGDTRWLLARRVAELHAGEVTLGAGSDGATVLLRLPPT
jgi:signal recognition particle receptor subunit beta